MDESQFWNIIASSRAAAAKTQRPPNEEINFTHERTLSDALRRLPPDQIASFDERFWEYHAAAYAWDLWAVAYWMHGGCSDDAFTDFRACLISLGRQHYEAALKNPDSLVDLIGLPDTPFMAAEGFQYVAAKTYEQVTGHEMPGHGELKEPYTTEDPRGEQFDFEDTDEMRKRFPRLLAKLPEGGD